MKNFMWVILIGVFLNISSLFGAEEDCGTTGSTSSSSQTGGIYIPSQGTLKVLVVFARFKNDTEQHDWWPVGGNPSGWDTYIDPNTQTGSTHLINLTNYYKTMSHNTFTVIGKAVSVEAPNTRSYYGSNRFLATKEVLQQKVDTSINFAAFDSWTFDSSFYHTNQPDGTVDMIVMVWREGDVPFQFISPYTGEASMGSGGSFTVESGTKTIQTGFRGLGSAGSGVTINCWGKRDQKYTFHAIIHEISHWLLGGGHPYSGGPIHEYWGMLSASSFGVCANAYEKEKLNWVKAQYPVVNITGNMYSPAKPIEDFVTTGRIYKYHPPNGGTNEYYYFENHQKLNIYDDATVNSNDKGVFVLHQAAGYNSNQNKFRCKTSNGQWNWENPSTNECFDDQTVPTFKPVSVNRAGSNNRDKLSINGGSQWLFYLDASDIGDWPIGGCGGWRQGDRLNNAFNTTYNNVFSPYSNPYSNTWDDEQTSFTMEISSQSGPTLYAKFYLTDPDAGNPSKPQSVQSTISGYSQAITTWDANQEPDMILYGTYNIYRQFYYYEADGITEHSVSEEKINSSPFSSTSYTDNFTVSWSGIPAGKLQYLRYKVVAIDNTERSSMKAFGNSIGILPSTISSNATIQSINICPQNSTVNSGYTLTVLPSTTLKFASGKSLIVNGVLDATGTSDERITLTSATGSWNYVKVQNGNSVFKYCTFEDGYNGLYLNGISSGSPTIIENCIFRDNTGGIRFLSSNLAKVKSCQMYDNSSYGVFSYNSDVNFTGNEIYNNGYYGVTSASGSLLQFYGNVIKNNGRYGISTANSDNIYIGKVYGWWGYNTIRDNSWHEVYAASGNPHVEACGSSIHDEPDSYLEIYNYPGNQTIYAQSIYWDANCAQVSSNVVLMANIYCSLPNTPPDNWEAQPRTSGSPIGKAVANPLAGEIEWFLDPDIPDGDKIRIGKDIIAANPKSVKGKEALFWIYSIIRSDYREDHLREKSRFFDYLYNIQSKYPNSEIGKLALQYMIIWKMLERDNSSVIEFCNEALELFTGEERKSVLTELVFTYIHSGQIGKAKVALQELQTRYSIEEETIALIEWDIADVENQIANGSFKPNKSLVSEAFVPKEFELFSNYPNPFNPSTTITYALPYQSSLYLTIYDITGRLIKSFSIPSQSSGYQSIIWDGTNENGNAVSSGVYLYRISIKSLENNERYIKTSKLMMLK